MADWEQLKHFSGRRKFLDVAATVIPVTASFGLLAED
jgi:hypothetical protein